ncbi:carboxy-S-adenosyl-L-methionine synthase CmoA [Neiella marina]|uniref:Carboxy-S-adenosyl-L-methionine synthase n=1 Tax=Neiella holothuriorum TaxID=2870530 RepID=A0ABS7EKJ6_9GAMM|nr:carboxy-S-adenosyl-L-methionine synthase CmoA [Neiella holothuriorum]
MSHLTDTIYASQQQVADFNFDQQVADVFPDMIQRSVPGYQTILHTLGLLTERYSQANSNIYDLGCSLGAATLMMRRHNKQPGCTIISVDNSAAMLERAEQHINNYRGDTPVQLCCQDLQETEIINASMVVLNFTLQFIAPEQRLSALTNIANGMNDGGLLLLSEKIQHPDGVMNDVLIDLHHEFKRTNGYSELEISQKRTALENVMITESVDHHLQRLKEAGFSHAAVWYQSYNFCSMLAIK